MYGLCYRAKAPLRIGLAGGGTDVDPYATERGGLVLNTTIDKYATCIIRPADDTMVYVHSDDGDSRADIADGPLDLQNNRMAEVVANHFGVKSGFTLVAHSAAPPGSGLGGSSTVMVSMISAFSQWLNRGMDRLEMARLAYRLERKTLGQQGGRQDQYAAAMGGFNLMRVDGDDVDVKKLNMGRDVIDELHSRALLCNTGTTRISAEIIKSQVDSYKKGDNEAALDESKKIARLMSESLEAGDIDRMGELLHTSWIYKKQFSEKISNATIDDMYGAARRAGAIGGKVSGAGGGGFMFFICRPDSKDNVIRAVKGVNSMATFQDFDFEPEGVTSRRYVSE